MKITFKSADENIKKEGPAAKPIKPSKKAKGSKIPIKGPNLLYSPERVKPKTPKTAAGAKGGGQNHRASPNNDAAGKDVSKAQRKQESEWKSLKKVDYQRLETVVEEGQVSSEESPSKPTCAVKQPETDKKSEGKPSEKVLDDSQNMNQLMEIEDIFTEDDEPKAQDTENTMDFARTLDIVTEELKENRLSSEKSLGGIMEIFPIFSNDKFLCSRDAISIQESEELDVSEKNVSQHPKQIVAENKNSVNGTKKPPSPKESGDSSKIPEKVVKQKESFERKLRHKILTDKKIVQKSSSHFINTLLMLDSFEEIRKNFIRGDALITNGDEDTKKKKSLAVHQVEMTRAMKLLPAMILTTIGVVSICLGFAWRAYEPPRWIDYLLQFLPFRHRRSRTLIQQFFDQLLKSLFLFCGKPLK